MSILISIFSLSLSHFHIHIHFHWHFHSRFLNTKHNNCLTYDIFAIWYCFLSQILLFLLFIFFSLSLSPSVPFFLFSHSSCNVSYIHCILYWVAETIIIIIIIMLIIIIIIVMVLIIIIMGVCFGLGILQLSRLSHGVGASEI